MAIPVRIPLVLMLIFGVSFVVLHNLVQSVPTQPVLPAGATVEFNPQWKDIAMQLLEKVRTGRAMSEGEKAILAQMYQSCKNGGYPAEWEQLAEELITLIEMIFDIHDQIVTDEGEHSGDRAPQPDGH